MLTEGILGRFQPVSFRNLQGSVPALVDQALWSTSLGLLGIVLVRWLTVVEYGVFASGMALVGLLVAIHTGLMTDPLLAFARGVFARQRAGYFAVLFRAHVGSCLGFACLGLATGAALLAGSRGREAGFVVALTFAAVGITSAFFTRRIAYASSRPWRAAAGSAILTATLGGSVGLVLAPGTTTGPLILLCVGGAGLHAAAWAARRSDFVRPTSSREIVPGAVRRHWDYGRYALLILLLNWLPWNAHVLLLAKLVSLEEAAGLRALQNVLVPIQQGLVALSVLALPRLAENHRTGEGPGSGNEARSLAILYFGLSAAWLLFVAALGPRLLGLIYAGAFAPLYDLAVWVAAVQLPLAIVMALGLLERAAGDARRALRVYLPFPLLALPTGALGGLVWGARGSVVGLVLAAFAALPVSMIAARRGAPRT